MGKSIASSSAKKRFLQAFVGCGVIKEACRLANIDRTTHQYWMADPEYAAAFEEAKKEAADNLETELMNRIYVGIEEPVIFQGEQCWEKDINGKPTGRPLILRKKDTASLIFAIKKAIPEYRDSYKAEITGAMTFSHGPDLSKLSAEQYAESRRKFVEFMATLGPAGDPQVAAGISAGGPEESEEQD